jgi:hypothetical protein
MMIVNGKRVKKAQTRTMGGVWGLFALASAARTTAKVQSTTPVFIASKQSLVLYELPTADCLS